MLDWHNAVHMRIGGSMARVDTSAAVLIFWPWHGFIDEMHVTWERRRP